MMLWSIIVTFDQRGRYRISALGGLWPRWALRLYFGRFRLQRKNIQKKLPFFQHKKGHWPAAFSSVAFNGPDRERGSALRRLGWHGRRREVGVSEISGVRSGAPSPCRRSSLHAVPPGASQAIATSCCCCVEITPSPIFLSRASLRSLRSPRFSWGLRSLLCAITPRGSLPPQLSTRDERHSGHHHARPPRFGWIGSSRLKRPSCRACRTSARRHRHSSPTFILVLQIS